MTRPRRCMLLFTGLAILSLQGGPPAGDTAWGVVPLRLDVATLKGQVVYDGEPPKPAPLKIRAGHPDAAHCHKGDTNDLTWEVDPTTRGVKNVVIWVRPAPGKSFKYEAIPEGLRKRTDAVVIEQQFCNYIPHVQAFNPSVFDGKKQVPTGQKFVVKNSATINHNVHWSGSPAIAGNADNKNLRPGDEIEITLKPARADRTGEDIVRLACNVHTWMTGRIAVLDTPFYAVTDKDGKFAIKHVPAGPEIYVVAWHEEAGDYHNFVLPEASPSRQGQKMTLAAGKETTLDFKIKKK